MSEQFSKVRSMNFPRCTLLGHGVVQQTADVCRNLMFGHEGLIISGGQTYEAAGKAVQDLMTDNGYLMSYVGVGNTDQENIDKALEAVKAHDAKFLLAIGGGSKIDIAKMVARETNLPFISIPTSVAHDGICSDRASVKTKEGAPQTMQALPPTAIIADTEIVVKAPFRYLASGCADVLSNFSALSDWDFARKIKDEEFSSSAYALSRYAAESILNNAPSIIPDTEEGVWHVLKPAIASGTSMCIAGNSRPTSGSEHMFSHALDLLHPGKAMHGEQCGVGTIMMMNLQGGNWKQIRDALKTIGAPTTAAELGISEEDVVDALVAANKVRKDRYTILGDNGLTRNAARNLARATGVI
ncbi:MAG: NAD(P)-dependent glycerol-1-phosphate dehydrogenase [archaeon]|nr:NAD(P)-dependent glycerol-1-phosphate dehydrogenase [archaeon]